MILYWNDEEDSNSSFQRRSERFRRNSIFQKSLAQSSSESELEKLAKKAEMEEQEMEGSDGSQADDQPKRGRIKVVHKNLVTGGEEYFDDDGSGSDNNDDGDLVEEEDDELIAIIDDEDGAANLKSKDLNEQDEVAITQVLQKMTGNESQGYYRVDRSWTKCLHDPRVFTSKNRHHSCWRDHVNRENWRRAIIENKSFSHRAFYCSTDTDCSHSSRSRSFSSDCTSDLSSETTSSIDFENTSIESRNFSWESSSISRFQDSELEYNINLSSSQYQDFELGDCVFEDKFQLEGSF